MAPDASDREDTKRRIIGATVAACDRLADAYRAALIDNAAPLDGPHRLDTFLDFYFNLLDGTRKPRDDVAYDAMMSLATGMATGKWWRRSACPRRIMA